MRLRSSILLLFALLSPLAAFAQDPKHKVNEQLWDAARRGDVRVDSLNLRAGARSVRKKGFLVRVSGRMIIARQFTAGIKERKDVVREADG